MDPFNELLFEVVQALGPMGFIFWLVHRNTTHTIPRLAKAFEDGVDRQRIDFKEITTAQRESFERMLTRQQDKMDKLLEARQNED